MIGLSITCCTKNSFDYCIANKVFNGTLFLAGGRDEELIFDVYKVLTIGDSFDIRISD
jgi:hypothetical protein